MKLKDKVKIISLVIVLILYVIITFIQLDKDYKTCMQLHNNQNYCSE